MRLDSVSAKVSRISPFRLTFLPGIEAFHATPLNDERYLLDDIARAADTG